MHQAMQTDGAGAGFEVLDLIKRPKQGVLDKVVRIRLGPAPIAEGGR